MPFHDGSYYPFTGDTQGTHSSAGILSLLNSPLSQPTVSGMTPSSGAATILPFKFRPRRESVDWRRINAVDIDLVVSQLDLDVLQEHISGVTFCSLDGERCQRCQSPVEPALVKILKLAQLTVEWLLHCQDSLTHSLRAVEERVAAAGKEREQLEEKVTMMTAELKQRKKIIHTQQSMFATLIGSGQKCPSCDKSFLSSLLLQNHMQRRHPGECDIECRSCGEKITQIESLKSEISSLKEQVVQQQLELQAKIAQEKEQQSLHKSELDRLQAERMVFIDRKIEDSRDAMRREMEFLYTRNIQALHEANQTAKHEKPASPIYSQPERDLDKEMLIQDVQKLELQLKKQDKKWRSRLQEVQDRHESEKNQLLNELSELQESSQRLQQEMGRRLQKTIEAQREQIRNISLNPPIKIVEVPVMVNVPAPEPKPKRVVLDSSSLSERKPVERRPKPAPEKEPKVTTSTLKINPNIKKEIRRDLEQSVVEKLENLGVKPDQSGLKDKEFRTNLAKWHSEPESIAKGMPDYWRQREEIASTVEQKLAEQRRGNEPAPESQTRSRQLVQVQQIPPRSSSLPSRATQVVSGPAVKQPKTPQPAPRARTTAQPKTSTPKTAQKTFTSKTPPFSSDERSNEEDTDVEEERHHQKHRRGKSLPPKASKASPVQSRQAQARQSFASNPQQARVAAGSAARTAVTKMESDDDEWSDVSELQEIDPKRLQSFKDQNGNGDKRNFGKENQIHDLARKMEKQFAERTVKKPAGGVSVLPERKDEVQEFTYTDLEESSDWAVSSLEDRRETAKPAQGSGPARKSLDSSSTSVWGTSTGKGAKSGLTDTRTGSTLKSSLCSLSDISDSEDISNK